ncbi:uncharacterized protein BJ171DRAFT_582453 [Polychytrium aggregatum]|uniref:uncharacterized protein n=1 Tax=Polychytrium aggregatum TaxID=110093 RepID=UPI0022FF1ABE|nr:uncharacterized protein BJ171DRAFT_582453 [Polychytrium aggregatum]KAI9204075.1 hypothetical protein BJ171DRAFT_582453 [Polychytrium aggregatum]
MSSSPSPTYQHEQQQLYQQQQQQQQTQPQQQTQQPVYQQHPVYQQQFYQPHHPYQYQQPEGYQSPHQPPYPESYQPSPQLGYGPAPYHPPRNASLIAETKAMKAPGGVAMYRASTLQSPKPSTYEKKEVALPTHKYFPRAPNPIKMHRALSVPYHDRPGPPQMPLPQAPFEAPPAYSCLSPVSPAYSNSYSNSYDGRPSWEQNDEQRFAWSPAPTVESDTQSNYNYQYAHSDDCSMYPPSAESQESIGTILESFSPCGPNGCERPQLIQKMYFPKPVEVPEYVKESTTKQERPLLSELLSRSCERPEQVEQEYWHFSAISKWFNGSPEKGLPLFALWPPCVRVYQYMAPRMLGIPNVDLRVSKVTPRLRRAVLLISSLQYRCFYCAAHSAASGSALHGSWRAQVKRSKDPNDLDPIVDPFDSRLGQGESDALFLVTAASVIPSKVNPSLKQQVRAHYKEDEYQQIACMSAYIGWTNAITDSLGMELEAGAILWAEEQLRDAGWESNRHAPETYDPHAPNVHLKLQAQAEESVPNKGLGRIGDLMRLMKVMQGSNSAESRWTRGFPSNHSQLDKWLKYTHGFVPEYIRCMVNKEAKRAVCFALWQFLLRPKGFADPCLNGDTPAEWSHGGKVLLWYVYTANTGNQLLQGHAAFLAHQMKVPQHILSVAAAGGCVGDRRLDCALDFIRRSATLKREYTAKSNQELYAAMNSPVGVMELVSSLGLFNMLHRLSAMLAPEPPRFEHEVKAFLSTLGAGLGLDPNKAGPQRDTDASPLEFLL